MLVLIADKDPYDLQAMRAALQAPDVTVVEARDGKEVLRLASEHLPDVVVVAASLGQMGGFAVSRELKTMADNGELPEPKVIVLLERDADAWLASWSLCTAYRTKPVVLEEFDSLVRSIGA